MHVRIFLYGSIDYLVVVSQLWILSEMSIQRRNLQFLRSPPSLGDSLGLGEDSPLRTLEESEPLVP
ncbi:hypothetical protein Syun_010423 [Stephania yunnanensis]|uniref:Uncharacterized protein n=1 Tax=Stephania yunnanensis TaxID=152371 RepID=A0AAP0KIK5_9MAGN